MTGARTYLDYNATTPLRPEVQEAMTAAMVDIVGNPSSVHQEGRTARKALEEAREKVAALAGASPRDVIFTSGATEANNWVMQAGWDAIVFSGIEHDAVQAPAATAPAETIIVGADHAGVADVGAMAETVLCNPAVLTALRNGGRVLLSLQAANNETGVCQPVMDVAQFCRAHDVSFHTDAVQCAGRQNLNFALWGADSMALSAHKIGGPSGVGALIVRGGHVLKPLLEGGGQEGRRRSGTENLLGIIGFGAAAELALSDVARAEGMRAMRDRMEQALQAAWPDAQIIGQASPRLPNTTAVAFPGQAAETLVIKFDLAGIAVSAGSACSSGKVKTSHVLDTMNLPPTLANSTIRISLGWNTTNEDIDTFIRTCTTVLRPTQQRAVA